MEEKPTPEYDAYRVLRKSSLYWLRYAQEGLELLEKIESLLPSLVRRRYVITALTPTNLNLSPASVGNDTAAADALHADVNKLFVFLLSKCQAGQSPDAKLPARALTRHDGTIHYEFTLTNLPGFDSLRVFVGGLPAGSACQITKRVTGSHTVDIVEYEMVCDDDDDVGVA